MSRDTPNEFETGDSVLVLVSPYDGQVGTVLRATDDEDHYLVALEDGKEAILSGRDMSLRH